MNINRTSTPLQPPKPQKATSVIIDEPLSDEEINALIKKFQHNC